MQTILFRPMGEGWKVPTRGSEGAAGWDLTAAADTEIPSATPTLVPTNLEIAIPEGHMLLVLPRSGLAYKSNLLIPNSPGLIDEDYRGHLQVIISWIPSAAQLQQYHSEIRRANFKGLEAPPCVYKINKGERIAQAVLVPYTVQNWQGVNELPATKRGASGFGSTGV